MNVLAVEQEAYSATKIYSEMKSGRKTLIFPSVIGPAEFGEDFLGTTEDNFIAELSLYPGKVRNFGETAIRLNRGGEMTADRDMLHQALQSRADARRHRPFHVRRSSRPPPTCSSWASRELLLESKAGADR